MIKPKSVGNAKSDRNVVIPGEWGMTWFNYLFFDTRMSAEGVISTNFGLPIPPTHLLNEPSSHYIETNKIISYMIKRIYTGDKSKLKRKNSKEMMTRDLLLIDRCISDDVPPDEIAELDSRIKHLVNNRLHKFETTGEIDPWISSIQKMMAKNNGLSYVQTGEDSSKDYSGQGTPIESIHRSKSPGIADRKKSDTSSEEVDVVPTKDEKFRKQLSKIEEEVYDTGKLSSNNEDLASCKSPFHNSRNMGKRVKSRAVNDTLKTIGNEARGQTDYITKDSALKTYIQKNLMTQDMSHSRKNSLFIANNFRQYSLEGDIWGSLDLDSAKLRSAGTSPCRGHRSVQGMSKLQIGSITKPKVDSIQDIQEHNDEDENTQRQPKQEQIEEDHTLSSSDEGKQ